MKFGTSGLRGPATGFTPTLISAYVTAFLDSCCTHSAEKKNRDRHGSARIKLRHLSLHVVVAQDSPAQRIEDLVGLRISAGEADYATASLFAQVLRATVPHAADEMIDRMAFLDYLEANKRFEAGQIDVLVALNAVPNPAYVRLAKTSASPVLAAVEPLAPLHKLAVPMHEGARLYFQSEKFLTQRSEFRFSARLKEG